MVLRTRCVVIVVLRAFRVLSAFPVRVRCPAGLRANSAAPAAVSAPATLFALIPEPLQPASSAVQEARFAAVTVRVMKILNAPGREPERALVTVVRRVRSVVPGIMNAVQTLRA